LEKRVFPCRFCSSRKCIIVFFTLLAFFCRHRKTEHTEKQHVKAMNGNDDAGSGSAAAKSTGDDHKEHPQHSRGKRKRGRKNDTIGDANGDGASGGGGGSQKGRGRRNNTSKSPKNQQQQQRHKRQRTHGKGGGGDKKSNSKQQQQQESTPSKTINNDGGSENKHHNRTRAQRRRGGGNAGQNSARKGNSGGGGGGCGGGGSGKGGGGRGRGRQSHRKANTNGALERPAAPRRPTHFQTSMDPEFKDSVDSRCVGEPLFFCVCFFIFRSSHHFVSLVTAQNKRAKQTTKQTQQ
jgi:hypothetical protein